ncbi:hypothetical protein ACFE04_022745 [Oxalis oulophora]
MLHKLFSSEQAEDVLLKVSSQNPFLFVFSQWEEVLVVNLPPRNKRRPLCISSINVWSMLGLNVMTNYPDYATIGGKISHWLEAIGGISWIVFMGLWHGTVKETSVTGNSGRVESVFQAEVLALRKHAIGFKNLQLNELKSENSIAQYPVSFVHVKRDANKIAHMLVIEYGFVQRILQNISKGEFPRLVIKIVDNRLNQPKALKQLENDSKVAVN